MGGGDYGCGSGLLGVTSNNKLHSPDRTAFALRAHAAPSGECNYYMYVCMHVCIHNFLSFSTNGLLLNTFSYKPGFSAPVHRFMYLPFCCFPGKQTGLPLTMFRIMALIISQTVIGERGRGGGSRAT